MSYREDLIKQLPAHGFNTLSGSKIFNLDEGFTVACAEVDRLQAEVADLRKDKERLDWLCSNCYFPNDAPNKGIYLAAAEDAIPNGKITLNFRQDEQTIRNAIDSALSHQERQGKGEGAP